MLKGQGIFTKHYNGLNDAQKQAVDTIEGPVMVVAGPGTGKTHILALRIANILLKTDTPPDGILALTFTEAGVDAMKKRLLSLIGPTAYKVSVYTFHGFCNEIIHTYPEYFPRIISAQAISDIESIMFIRTAIDQLKLEKLKPFGDPYFYVQPIRNAISTLKREHKTPRDVLTTTERLKKEILDDPTSIHEKGAHKGKMKGEAQTRLERLTKEHELGLVFETYEQMLTEKKKFDFEDMISEVVRALSENETFRLATQEQYLYILADEHQDANGAQNTLLELLTSYHESPNLFIVGDEKQAIFRFQGATLDSFDHFKKVFPSARLIALTDSYRSGTALLDAAHSLMKESIPSERHPRLVSHSAQSHLALLETRTFSTEENEVAWVAADIALRIGEGVSPGDIAVIFRTNADAHDISHALSLNGVLHTLDSKSSVLREHSIAQLVTYVRLCVAIGSDELLGYVLHMPWTQMTSHDAYKVIIHAQRLRRPFLEILRSKELLHEAKVVAIDQAYQLGSTLEALARAAQEDTARDFFDLVLHKSGFLSYVLGRPDAIPILNAVRGLTRTLESLSASKTLYTGADFVRDIGLYEEYGIEIEPDVEPKERTNAVHLVTAHRSKGLEYEYVYLIHARDGHWGNRVRRDALPLSTLGGSNDTGDIEDERRLFYVALTRAKQYVSISYGTHSAQRTKESVGTQFLLEIDQELLHAEETDTFERTRHPEDMFVLKPSAETMGDAAFLRDAFLEQGLSATALNNYLDCPWKYFYRNLVRIPEKPTSSSLYGNALHNALRLFRDLCASTEIYQPLEILLAYLKTSIDAQGFSPTSYTDAYEKGIRALTEWHAAHTGAYVFRAMCEKKFEVYLPLPEEPLRILLRGMIDVIEYTDDGSVTIIDYKTGKHKSRNEIEGKTKNATGDYKRQLDFYCILLDLAGMDRPEYLTLQFIEPDASGNTDEHVFSYDAESVAELKETIIRVVNEIYSLEFLTKGCNEKDCAYCELHAHTYQKLP